jgi:DNA-directed RNA polymerase subunit beta
LVGTGIEKEIAYDSGVMTISRNEGIVMEVTSDRIIVESGNSHHPDVYYLKKYRKSNQETCLNQHPLVKTGEHVKKGQVIADGSATQNGELALGRNVLVAFMPWEGYNFEDAIVVSERLLKEDMFSSVHIKEETVSARDVHIGMEEITADISGVGTEMLRNLTSDGVIRVGANVHPGDILVGKVAPKGKSRPTPEERLLRVIFGKKSEEVDNVSLYANPGVEGVILDVKIFERHDRQSSHSKAQEAEQKRKLRAGIRKHKKQIDNQLEIRLQELDNLRHIKQITGEQCEREKKQERAVHEVNIKELDEKLQRGLERLSAGDELPLNVHKLVKVYIASRRKLSVGDKLAGRHGNKGVVACILPVEDMPYLPDGTPVDVVLNPLGVPSRMNVGQIFETMLGWAADKQNCRMLSPVFDGATEDDVIRELEKAGLPKSGKTTLYDGRTGEPFQEKITVGNMYMMKLMHMVEDKLHARSTGPYSLITRQPLGGKAQFGGQRFGEMEVWAVEGYGAASILQEFLTLKSDDIEGRERLLISLIKGSIPEKPGIPESFRVLLQELRALGLNVEIQKSKAKSWTEVGK